jgi:hypothetical protein
MSWDQENLDEEKNIKYNQIIVKIVTVLEKAVALRIAYLGRGCWRLPGCSSLL